MIELDEQIRQDLAQLREREGPSSAAERRMLAALHATLGGPPGPEGLGGDSAGRLADPTIAAPTAKLAFAAKVVGATLGLTSAGLIALRVAVVAVRAITHEPTPEPDVQQRPPPSAEPELPAPPAIDVAQAEAPETLAPPSPPSPRQDGQHTAARQRDAPEPVDDLAVELALLEAAHAASSPAAALVELERHRERFPAGSLADERELMRVETLCELGRIDTARSVAEALLSARPNSPLRPRVQAACPTLALGHEK